MIQNARDVHRRRREVLLEIVLAELEAAVADVGPLIRAEDLELAQRLVGTQVDRLHVARLIQGIVGGREEGADRG
jgi:hypothetical protein